MAEQIKRPNIGDSLTPQEAMLLAIQEAQKAYGKVSPNPLVGCCILDSNSKFLSLGYHKQLGFAHAEVDALDQIIDTSQLVGAEVYVTLEPCAHHGRTPPCANRLANLKLKKVVFGIKDPNPLVSGKGQQIIQNAGIECTEFKDLKLDELTKNQILTKIKGLAEIFLYNQKTSMPFVAFKIGSSLDGMTALKNGQSKWITGPESREEVQKIRSMYDAIIIGRKCFEIDNPSLNIRFKNEVRENTVLVLDPKLKALQKLKDSQLYKVRNPQKIIWVYEEGQNSSLIEELNIQSINLPTTKTHEIDLNHLLQKIWDKGLRSILVEGGAQTYSAFLKQLPPSRIHYFIAPKLIGAKNAQSWSEGFFINELQETLNYEIQDSKIFGKDIYLSLSKHS